MGLTEKANYSQDTMTSTLYVNHAGPKDVGKYRLSDPHNKYLQVLIIFPLQLLDHQQ